MRNSRIRIEAVPVNQQMLRSDLQLRYGSVHGQKGSIQDINLIYFLGCHYPYSPGCSFFLDYRTQFITLFLCQFLGVIEHFILKSGRKNDGCSIDGSCQTTTTGLITTGFYQVFM